MIFFLKKTLYLNILPVLGTKASLLVIAYIYEFLRFSERE